MSVSRRRFLSSGAVLSAGLLLKPGTFILGQESQRSDRSPEANTVHSYRREMFEPYVGDVFRVRVGKQIVDLKLVALDNLQRTSRGITTGKIARTDGFSLRFQATTPLPAGVDTHNLNHSKVGSFDLFMTQSSSDARFIQTAIINHVV
jgi:hypothetical protein